MKQVTLLMMLIIIFSCSKDNADECAEIEEQYLKALGYTGGSLPAIERLKEQYEEKKRNAGCN
ncbi:hypothetical protein [Yeosuana sp.]|uniref:hypothetical protein n=1 Tax=Yeosuana sp. TaxID=2529388 RepID=UPI004054DC1D